MRKSYEEILRVLARLGRPHEGFVFTGSTAWLPEADAPARNPAVDDLIARARPARDAPLYVVAIGAVTNVAAALLLAPEISSRIVVIWLGGNALDWPSAAEFNLQQDLRAARLLFDCGAPLVHVPCYNVTNQLSITQAELEQHVKGRSALGDYLCEIFAAYQHEHDAGLLARSKPLWDVGPVAWLVNPAWVDTVLVHSPILTEQHTWSRDPHRHLIREARFLDRDAILSDLFRKVAAR